MPVSVQGSLNKTGKAGNHDDKQPAVCLSPVAVLGVDTGAPIKTRVAGVGRTGSVSHFPGSAATHSQGCDLDGDQ